MSLTGGCQCGAIRYEIHGEPLGFARCHCTDCQRQSGSAFGLSLYVAPGDVVWTGEMSQWNDVAASGRKVIRDFCPTCGTRLMNRRAEGGDFLSLKAGTLDPGHDLMPRAELWTDSALPWVPLIADVPTYPGQPQDHEALRAAWSDWRRGKTLAFYDDNAARYADYSEREEPHPRLSAWLDTLTPGSRLLDLGCGVGWATAQMRQRGFAARAMDGSRGLAEQAKQRHGVEVELVSFGELVEKASFDAVWAFFSLMHAPRDRMPDHLRRIYDAMVPGGRLYLGLKEGEGAARDPQGRLYTYYTETELRRRLDHGGFEVTALTRGEGVSFDGTPTANLYVEATRG
ncbi:GFA family protein [Pontivivens nitratireducens]|nr:GFA family protein [Pontibrevibacter nitratireducens]